MEGLKMIERILRGLIKIQNIVKLSFVKAETRTYKNSTHQESRSLFSKIHQEINQQYVISTDRAPEVILKLDGFTYNTGRLDLIFENTGHVTAIIQELKIGENNVNIEEFSLGLGQQIRKYVNVSGFNILEEKLDAPNFELIYKDFSSDKKYKTIGDISQESRDDGKYNIGKISEISILTVNQDSNTSNLEKHVLEKLYSDYKKTGRKTKWKTIDAFKELGIKDGQDVSTLHDSKFVSIVLDGTHECFVITPDGIRYMENH